MIDGLTKERIEAFQKERGELNSLLWERGIEILRTARDFGVELGVTSCDNVYISKDKDGGFYLEDNWRCFGESGTDYSTEIPISALYDDEVLKKFLADRKADKDKEIEEYVQRQEKEDWEEYERLKIKFGK